MCPALAWTYPERAGLIGHHRRGTIALYPETGISNKTLSSAERYVAYLETRLPEVEGYLETRASAGTKRAASIVPQPLARS